ncbi:MAG TPA: magnesium transporter [Gammaproteobacteria bacterium]|nr:magnesium transporter [Gammaproteobacteria bacterium]
MIESTTPAASTAVDQTTVRKLVTAVQRRAPLDAVDLLARESDEMIAEVLGYLHPPLALKILMRFPDVRRAAIVPEVNTQFGTQLSLNQKYPEESVGRLMEPAGAVFGMGVSVRKAIEKIREVAKESLLTYAYVIDDERRLQGVIVMRDLLLAEEDTLLIDIMVENPFFFHPETTISEAMRAVVHRHYPVYPVCDANRCLLGLVQGYMLFEEQAFEMSAQAGRMVGVDKEEHLSTAWPISLKFRQPWLQINLLTAFIAAAVVGQFEDTISQVVVLAVFLPVLAGQSGNTGCQALAITLRGLTLGEFENILQRQIIVKEALLGLLNGLLVGVVAAAAMYFYANHSHAQSPLMLALVVLLAMIGACVAACVTGVLIPLTLKRLGADPVTSSSIFLTTATDVTSMGLFLWLAKSLVL